MIVLVKRKGRREHFDERKVYASSYSACLNAQLPEKDCEKVANSVTKFVKDWIKKKREISSDTLFRIIAQQLRKHNKEAAFLYVTHRDIS